MTQQTGRETAPTHRTMFYTLQEAKNFVMLHLQNK